MGASKRLCEMVIQSMDAVSKSGRMDLLPLLHGHRDNAEELAKQAEICLKKAEKEQTDGKDSETMGNTARLKIEVSRIVREQELSSLRYDLEMYWEVMDR